MFTLINIYIKVQVWVRILLVPFSTDKVRVLLVPFLTDQIWKLCTILRVKVFILRLVHRKTPTFAYLHMLNIGPNRECSFCGLEAESDEHVLWT